MKKIFVSNIPTRVTPEEAEAYFTGIAPGATIRILHNPSTAESLGFGTLEVSDS